MRWLGFWTAHIGSSRFLGIRLRCPGDFGQRREGNFNLKCLLSHKIYDNCTCSVFFFK